MSFTLAALACDRPPSVAPAAGPEARPAATDTEAPPATTAAPAAADPDRIDEASAREETDRILHAVAKARNLAVRSAVAVDVIDKPGIRAFAKDSMYEFTTPDEMRMLGRIESALGVVPPGSDPEAVILELLEQGVLGLYDPKRKTLFIGDFVPKSMLSMVVGHEIAHGLQDMYFDLHKLQEPMRHASDAESARRFLIEGEAQAAYLAWVSGDAGVAALAEPVLQAMSDQALELAGVASAYPILARSLQMPYADGAATVARLVQRDGWGAIDKLYEKLPESTEQMLHLDKLLARERPIPVEVDAEALAPLMGPTGLRMVWHDDIGEATLLAMLAERRDTREARAAAAGWGGDHFLAFEREAGKPGATMLAAATAWDSPRDAEEFERAFSQYLAEHTPGAHVIERRAHKVVFAVGIPDGIDPVALRKALWRGTHVGK